MSGGVSAGHLESLIEAEMPGGVSAGHLESLIEAQTRLSNSVGPSSRGGFEPDRWL